MDIDIDELTEDELIKLNHRIVERLKWIRSYQTHQEMMRFTPGDKVSFDQPGGDPLLGTLVKFNKKTVTVITEAGQKWNVSPKLLRRVKDAKESTVQKGQNNVIDFQNKD